MVFYEHLNITLLVGAVTRFHWKNWLHGASVPVVVIMVFITACSLGRRESQRLIFIYFFTHFFYSSLWFLLKGDKKPS